jgi:hypothetical protein
LDQPGAGREPCAVGDWGVGPSSATWRSVGAVKHDSRVPYGLCSVDYNTIQKINNIYIYIMVSDQRRECSPSRLGSAPGGCQTGQVRPQVPRHKCMRDLRGIGLYVLICGRTPRFRVAFAVTHQRCNVGATEASFDSSIRMANSSCNCTTDITIVITHIPNSVSSRLVKHMNVRVIRVRGRPKSTNHPKAAYPS